MAEHLRRCHCLSSVICSLAQLRQELSCSSSLWTPPGTCRLDHGLFTEWHNTASSTCARIGNSIQQTYVVCLHCCHCQYHQDLLMKLMKIDMFPLRKSNTGGWCENCIFKYKGINREAMCIQVNLASDLAYLPFSYKIWSRYFGSTGAVVFRYELPRTHIHWTLITVFSGFC